MNKLNNFLEQCEESYYKGEPIIPDEVYDRLKTQYDSVGYRLDSKAEKIPHAFQMYSLQKVFEGEDTPPAWAKDDACVVTPKLDGAAISISYHGHKLWRAITRGDGKHGVDVTDLVKHLVPPTVPKSYVQITGEVVAPKEIPNARNYAAGALNLKSEEEFLSRTLNFVAHGLEPTNGNLTYVEDMKELQEFGFDTILNCNAELYPQDGQVFRIDNNKVFNNLGHTSHHPRGAFALKTRDEGVVTTLLDVEWNVGKSGAVTPVAILEPIVIEDATISRATLHNAGFIEGLGLEIGCKVEVIRSGKIIPKIVRRIDD
tara:strand:+ start:170 stop:1114 length:945 start_codon:yes stop_codon:yes gene_type:complete